MNAHNSALYMGLRMHPTMAVLLGVNILNENTPQELENRRRTEKLTGAHKHSSRKIHTN